MGSANRMGAIARSDVSLKVSALCFWYLAMSMLVEPRVSIRTVTPWLRDACQTSRPMHKPVPGGSLNARMLARSGSPVAVLNATI